MGKRRKKKKPPCNVTFIQRDGLWCILGPVVDIVEGALIQARKKSGQREWVRVLQILERRPGSFIVASFSNKEVSWAGATVRNPGRRGRSR